MGVSVRAPSGVHDQSDRRKLLAQLRKHAEAVDLCEVGRRAGKGGYNTFAIVEISDPDNPPTADELAEKICELAYYDSAENGPSWYQCKIVGADGEKLAQVPFPMGEGMDEIGLAEQRETEGLDVMRFAATMAREIHKRYLEIIDKTTALAGTLAGSPLLEKAAEVEVARAEAQADMAKTEMYGRLLDKVVDEHGAEIASGLGDWMRSRGKGSGKSEYAKFLDSLTEQQRAAARASDAGELWALLEAAAAAEERDELDAIMEKARLVLGELTSEERAKVQAALVGAIGLDRALALRSLLGGLLDDKD